MAKKFDVVAVTGKYTDSAGKEKSRYQTVGVVLETKNGPMLKLESVPIGWDGWAYLNEPQARDGDKPAKAPGASVRDEFKDGVPF